MELGRSDFGVHRGRIEVIRQQFDSTAGQRPF
jgi:uncharacterized protein (DUF1499 family)